MAATKTTLSTLRLAGTLSLVFTFVFSLISPTYVAAHGSASTPIVNVGGKCLDVRGGKAKSKTAIQLYSCNASVAQEWQHPGDGTFRNRGLCLDVQGGKKAAKTLVQLYTCNDSPAQQWKIGENNSIIATNSGLCLDSKLGKLTDKNPIWLYECNGSKAQQWTVTISEHDHHDMSSEH